MLAFEFFLPALRVVIVEGAVVIAVVERGVGTVVVKRPAYEFNVVVVLNAVAGGVAAHGGNRGTNNITVPIRPGRYVAAPRPESNRRY